MARVIYQIGKPTDPNNVEATDDNAFADSNFIFDISSVLATGEIGQIGNVDLTSTSPALADNHFLVYNGTNWVHEQPSDALLSLGVTASAVELNYLDIANLGTSEASKALTADADGNLIIPDSDKFQFGAGLDMTLYHDGTDSYITNQTGALKIATETSGIAVQIGHATSEVTIGDNLNITGDLVVDTSILKVDSTNNRVGIGTASPAKVLHVVDTTGDAEIARFEGGDGNISINGGAKITFSRNAINYLTCTDIAGGLRFETGGAGNNRLTIDSSGDSTFSGHVILDNAKTLRLSETDANGSHYIALKAPDSVTADTTLTLPDGTGTNGQVLTSSGASGVLTWSNASGGVTSASITGQSEKTSINDNDLLLIADSQDSNNLKKVKRSKLVEGLTTNNTYSAKTANFSAQLDYHYSINTTGGAVTVNLPAITVINAGKSLVVKFRSGTDAVTITPDSGDTIEGLNSLNLTDSQAPGQSVILVSDGTSAWEII